MTLLSLWGKITGADKKFNVQNQQGSVLGRIGDYTVVFPYGLSADLPDDAMFRLIAPGIVIPWNIDRPSDAARGEPAFFHPSTNTRIIARADGDLDVITDNAEGTPGNVNVTATKVNITADDLIDFIATNTATITAPDITLAGDVTTEKFGTNGTSAQGSFVIGAAATDLASVITLTNNIRSALIANGIGS